MRFGAFEANLASGQLRKHGIRLKLYDQPFQILAMLLARPGELIAREEIQRTLWPAGTFVDFENGLNSAVNRLRDALGDSAEEPKFIETVPRRGYRFIAPIEELNAVAKPIVEAKPEPPVRHSKRWFWAAVVSVTAVLVLAAFPASRAYRSATKTVNFHARDWVLIANFENRTGESIFDGTLEYALERELSNSRFVNVVPRERVNDVLRLMRRPRDSKVDAALGKEICLRDGSIRILLTGRAEKLGTTYVLSAELVDPTRGVTVASISEEDPAESRLASTVRRLSDRVRRTLGEKRDLIQQSNARLEKVTTPSLHALQLYTQANDLMLSGQDAAAGQLLEQAVTEDPSFASGHLLLAYVYANTHLNAKARPELQRALDLADSVPERERLFILGSYNGARGDTPKTIQAYEALLRLYPDHYWATNNLMEIYEEQGRFEDARNLVIHFADINPGSLSDNADAVQAKGISEQDWKGAQPYLDRARELLAQEGEAADREAATFIKLLPVYQDWLQGNIQHAYDELLRIDQTGGLNPVLMGGLYDAFGCLKEEAKHYQVSPPRRWADDALGLIEFERGNWGEVKTHLRRYHAGVGSSDAMLMARTGMWSDVERSLRNTYPGPDYKLTAGELALDEGHTTKGIALLETGLNARASLPQNSFFLGSESLARTYEKESKFDDALRILEQASAEKPRIFGVAWPGFWMRTELQLADLYRKMGRVSDAEKVEKELSKLLIYADPDHPILRALQERHQRIASSARGASQTPD